MSNEIFVRTTTFANASGRLFFGRPAGKISMPVFIFFTIFAILQSVPEWRFFDWGLTFYESMFLTGIGGTVCGFLGAERRFAGAIALGIGGISTVAAIGLLLYARTFMTVIPNQRGAIIFMLVGLLPGLALYWLIERIFGRPAHAIDVARARIAVQATMAILRKRSKEFERRNVDEKNGRDTDIPEPDT